MRSIADDRQGARLEQIHQAAEAERVALAVYALSMRQGRSYAAIAFGLLVVAGVIAWRTWPRASQGSFDPVGAVIALAALAVGLIALRQSARSQRQADTDVTVAAKRLATAVEGRYAEARRQLLGGHDRTIDVQFTFRAAQAHDAAGAGKKGTLEQIVTYYCKLQPRRMVITGAPGSGKTVLAVQLILGLLKDRTEEDPVPVLISAASLDTSHPAQSAVAVWLTEHLKQAYQLPDITARQLVEARRILPVLDGLDEMDAIEQPGYNSRAGHAIRACNTYLDRDQKAAIVLTCRIGQYEALEQTREWVHDAALVELRPVALQAARAFLTRRVTDKSRWQPLLSEMRPIANAPLRRALSTPWRLTLAATIYDQRHPITGTYLRDPTELTSPDLNTEDKIRDRLLSLFIPATIAAYGGTPSASFVHQWLAVLAGYLNMEAETTNVSPPTLDANGSQLSSTDLVLHQLWPLAGRAPRLFIVSLVTATWLGLAAWLLASAPVKFQLWNIFNAIVYTTLATSTTFYVWKAEPTPRIIDSRQLRTSAGRRRLGSTIKSEVGAKSNLKFGLAAGLVFGSLLGSIADHDSFLHLIFGMAVGMVAGVVAITPLAFLMGLMLDSARSLLLGVFVDANKYEAAEPLRIIRTDVMIGLATGLTTGALGYFIFGLNALPFELSFGFIGWLAVGLSSWRYVALLACTRRWTGHWLPWRLGRFLQWSYQIGLMRAAGIGYQFRHKELQDYLARNPTPNRLLVRLHALQE